MSGQSKGILVHFIGYPISVLGPGTRVGIWLQGCTIRCKHCIAPESWDFDPKKFVNFNDIKEKLHHYSKYSPDGVTISGGEPFDQPEALLTLLKIVNELRYPSIMVYSGYSFEFLLKIYSSHLHFIDILVTEPFDFTQTDKKIWRGSDNQQIHLISDRANDLFNEIELNQIEYQDERDLQIFTVSNSIFIAGIPKRSDIYDYKDIL